MSLARVYYAGSILVAALPLLSCASASSVGQKATVVPYATLGQAGGAASKLGTEPLVIVFEPGDRVPVELSLQSSILATAPSPARFELVTTRRFWVLFTNDGPPRISLDGKDYDTKPENSFRLGFQATKEGSKLVLDLGFRR